MRRPFAVFGLSFLVVSLAAGRLPAHFVFPLTILFAALWVFLFALSKQSLNAKKKRLLKTACVVFWAASLAALSFFVFMNKVVYPVQQLAGRQLWAKARVEDVQPAYGGDATYVTLRVLETEGAAQSGYKVQVYCHNSAAIGDLVRCELRYYQPGNKWNTINWSKGCYIGANAVGTLEKTGVDQTFLCIMRQFQRNIGDRIRQNPNLPGRLSPVMAAMSIGDRRGLDPATVQAYRSAGLSHMLVVSGLHMTLLCTVIGSLSDLAFRKKQISSLLCVVFVLFFMTLTGLKPSVVRSGVVCIMVYIAPLFYRRADVYTSLGLAALLLCLQNPFAVQDVGLQLSFAATLGTVWGGSKTTVWRRRMSTTSRRIQRFFIRFAGSFIVPVCTTITTLPILVLNELGAAVLGVPMNVLAVWMLGPIVICGILTAVLTGIPVLGALTPPLTLVSGIMLLALEKLTLFCDSLRWAYLPLGGAYGLAAVLAIYLFVIAGIAIRQRLVLPPLEQRRFYLCAGGLGLLLFAVALGLPAALGRGTVQVTIVGNKNASSVVITQNGQSVVLYLNRQTAPEIQRVLRQQRAEECVLLMDMRRTAQSTEYEGLFHPNQVVVVERDLFSHGVYEPLEDVTVMVKRQSTGNLACVDVQGFTIGVVSGAADCMLYPPLDVLVAGSGQVDGKYDILIALGEPPDWASESCEIYGSDETPQIWIRPGKSVVYRGVYDGVGT